MAGPERDDIPGSRPPRTVREDRGRPFRRWLRRHPFLAILAGTLLLTTGGLAWLWLSLPDVEVLRRTTPDTTAYMRLRVREARDQGRRLEIRRRAVALSRIPSHLQDAVRVAEDAAFYGHAGVDWYEVRRALVESIRELEPPRGASTITQQLSRNLFLSPDRTPWRKLREALLAVKLERALAKDRIFELYLNSIELGNGIFGVDAASRHYFRVPVSALTPEQSVELAATIPAPRTDNPDTRTPRFHWRARLIAGRLRTMLGREVGVGTGVAEPTDTAAGLPYADTVPTVPDPDTAPGLPYADTVRARDTTRGARDSVTSPDTTRRARLPHPKLPRFYRPGPPRLSRAASMSDRCAA